MIKKISSIFIVFTLIFTTVFKPGISVKAAFSVDAAAISFNTLTEYNRTTTDETWYKFNLKAGQAIALLDKASLTNGSISAVLFDENGNEVSRLYNKDNSYHDYIYNGETGISSYTSPISGTYYLKIYGDGYGKYSLAVYKSWNNAGETDGNRNFYSTLDTAQYIKSGRFTLSSYGRDSYRFTAQAGTQINVSAEAYLNSGSLYFKVYDENYKQVFSLNNINNSYHDYIYNGETAAGTYTVPVTGTYFLQVTGAPGDYDLSYTNIDADKDSDADGLKDSVEYMRGTNPLKADTDSDGSSDYAELMNGKNPLISTEMLPSALAGAASLSNAVTLPVTNNEFSADRVTTDDTWYKINLKAGENITVVEKSGLTKGSIQAAVVADDGTQLAKLVNKNNSYHDYMYNGETGVTSYQAPINATYYIRVFGDGYGKYSLALYKGWYNAGITDGSRTFYSTGDTARYIASGRYSLNGYGRDVYRFTAAAGTKISITAKPYLTTGQMSFELFDKSWRSTGKLTNVNNSYHDYLYNGETGSLTYTVPVTGTYYLNVSGDLGDYDINAIGMEADKDTDGDKLNDAVEYVRDTSTVISDTDGDGTNDYAELMNGKNPLISTELLPSSIGSSTSLAQALAVPVINKEFTADKVTADETWYKINLKAGQDITLVEKSRLTKGSIQVAVLSDDATQLKKLVNKDNSYHDYMYNGETGTASYEAPIDGTYYIRVFGDGYGKYSLALYNSWYNAGESDSSRAFYSTFDTAKYIKSGRYSLSSYGSDVYRFTATAGSKISLTAKTYLTSGQMYFRIYDSNISNVASLTNINNSYHDYLYNGESGSVTYTIPVTGTYFLSVSGDLGDYDLSTAGIDSDRDTDGDKLNDAVEYFRGTNTALSDSDGDGTSDCQELLNGSNPTVGTELNASSVANATSIVGAIAIPVINNEFSSVRTTGSDTWYKVNLKAGEEITVIGKPSLIKGTLQIAVISEDGTQVAKLTNKDNSYHDYMYGNETGSTAYQAPLNGTYYVRIFGDGYGKYSLGLYNSWFNAGTTDNSRSFYSTFATAKYADDGKYRLSSYKSDAYRFTAKAGSSISITAKAYLTTGNMSFRLYDENLSAVSSLTNINNSYHDYLYNGETGSLTYSIPVTGTYFLVASGDIGDYDLSFKGITLDKDSDNDKLSDAAEYMRNTNPALADTDGDKTNDYTELLNGNNPNVGVELNQAAVSSATSLVGALTLPSLNKELSAVRTTGDDTWYKINLKAGENLTVVGKARLTKGTLQFAIADETGKQVARLTNKDNSYHDYIYNWETAVTAYTAPVDGTYYIRVFGDGTGKYTLGTYKAWYNSGVTDTSRNFYSTFETSRNITVGIHTLSDFGADYYRVDLTGGTSVSFAISAFLNSGTMGAQLYDKNMKLIKDFTDINNSYHSYVYSGGTAKADYTVPLTDTYYIRVYGNQGDYNLSYSNIAPAVTSLACNGDIRVNFSETIAKGFDFGNITVTDSDGVEIDISKEIVDNTLIIKPNYGLNLGSRYTLNIPAAAIKNMAGAVMNADYASSFTAVDTDINNDGVTDIHDLALTSNKYNTREGQSTWDSTVDMNGDKIIDVYDLVMISRYMQ